MSHGRGSILVIHPDEWKSQAPVYMGLIEADIDEMGFDMRAPDVEQGTDTRYLVDMLTAEQYVEIWIYSGNEYPCVCELCAEATRQGIPVLQKSAFQ